MNHLDTPHGRLDLPAFLPDATRGGIRTCTPDDLAGVGVQALVMNAFHLAQRPGSTVIATHGGLQAWCGWNRPILTDSGGFQAWSLLRARPGAGTLDDRGLRVRLGDGSKVLWTPERAINIQWRLGSDLMVCLDQCTAPEDPPALQADAVRRTLAWARTSKTVFTRLVDSSRRPVPPRLFAVIQGGGDQVLRRQCAEELLAIGFDGFGFGGWPIDQAGRLAEEPLAWVRQAIPHHYPLHALGVGHPDSLVAAVRLGYTLADCTMPTRDARHGRLFVETSDLLAGHGPPGPGFFRSLALANPRWLRHRDPVCPWCDCPACRHPLGYLHHLYVIKDPTALRLATLHNLRFWTRLMLRLGTRP